MSQAEIIALLSAVFTPVVTYFVLRSHRRQDLVFSEGQFKLYNNLWSRLCELETSMEDLWTNGVAQRNLNSFIKTVGATDQMVRESALLLDQSDFDQMRKILESVKGYRAGKERLLNLKDVDERTAREIQEQIEANYALLEQYQKLKISILSNMREKIGIN